MILHAIILSFQITAIYILFQEGMLLGRVRAYLATKLDLFLIMLVLKYANKPNEATIMKSRALSKYIQKPLWDCLPCMSGIWTIILTWSLNIPLIFVVCGINVIIDKIVNYETAP